MNPKYKKMNDILILSDAKGFKKMYYGDKVSNYGSWISPISPFKSPVRYFYFRALIWLKNRPKIRGSDFLMQPKPIYIKHTGYCNISLKSPWHTLSFCYITFCNMLYT